ncbi:MAG: signal recognition particle protein [Acidobacteriota bacterium]
MFDNLSERLSAVFRNLRGQGHLTEANMREGLREIRKALLEADVHFRVARDLLKQIEARALGETVLRSLTPGQQLVKVVRDEMTDLLGGAHVPLRLGSRRPAVILMTGLQGSGKTTTSAKLGRFLRGQGRTPLLVPADLSRPAAVEQLRKMGAIAGVDVVPAETGGDPVAVAQAGVAAAVDRGHDVVIIDTAGRLHIDDDLMAQLCDVRDAVNPVETLYVADSMTGQDAVNSSAAFNEALGVSGIILTKMDGDARGGAALSIRAMTGVPIRFVGVGEKVEALEPFHPDRLASRILGMGDVLTLIEKAQAVADDEEGRRLTARMRQASFSLEDFRDQLRKMRQLGPLDQLLKLMPGSGKMALPDLDGHDLRRTEAIIDSMTPGERNDHTVINGSRRRRIARGSGTRVQDVNRLLKQFAAMHKMLRKMGGRLDRKAFRAWPT